MRRAVLLLLCLTLLCCACGKRRDVHTGEYRYVIGVSQANMIEPWRYNINREISQGLGDHPDINAIFADATQDAKKQAEDILEMMDYGIDLLLVSPQDAEALEDVLADVCGKIPVIVLGTGMGNGCTAVVRYNDYLIGQMAADYIGRELLPEGGKIILLEGMMGSEISDTRAKGFYEAIEKYPGVEVAESIVADWLRDKAEDRMKDYFVKSAEVDVVFALNDEMAYGAYIAATKLRRNGIRFVGVDGFEGEFGGVSLVRRGILQATLRCPAAGDLALECAVKILSGEEVAPETVVSPTLITPDSLERGF